MLTLMVYKNVLLPVLILFVYYMFCDKFMMIVNKHPAHGNDGFVQLQDFSYVAIG